MQKTLARTLDQLSSAVNDDSAAQLSDYSLWIKYILDHHSLLTFIYFLIKITIIISTTKFPKLVSLKSTSELPAHHRLNLKKSYLTFHTIAD